MYRVQSVCRNFLWEGSSEYSKAPLIAWNVICRSKAHGGLGIQNGSIWNRAAIGKLVWWLASKADHLWVKWVSNIYLRGQDWKLYKASQNSSWAWRKICETSGILRNGYIGNQWQGNAKSYTIAHGYKWLMGDYPRVRWKEYVWNRLCLPRVNFINWLYVNGKLLTLDRLQQMNITTNVMCCLCEDAAESNEHLFFRCHYSRLCLIELSSWIGINWPHMGTFTHLFYQTHTVLSQSPSTFLPAFPPSKYRPRLFFLFFLLQPTSPIAVYISGINT